MNFSFLIILSLSQRSGALFKGMVTVVKELSDTIFAAEILPEFNIHPSSKFFIFLLQNLCIPNILPCLCTLVSPPVL